MRLALVDTTTGEHVTADLVAARIGHDDDRGGALEPADVLALAADLSDAVRDVTAARAVALERVRELLTVGHVTEGPTADERHELRVSAGRWQARTTLPEVAQLEHDGLLPAGSRDAATRMREDVDGHGVRRLVKHLEQRGEAQAALRLRATRSDDRVELRRAEPGA